MLTVDDYGAIRRAYRDRMPIKQIAIVFGHSRNTIRKILRPAEPNPIPQARNRTAPVLGPLHAIIDQILLDDQDAPPKQRHTAMQVFRRLQGEHDYVGCYGQVQRYLRAQRRTQQETFVPLGHLPGQRLEADFGHIHVDFPDGRRLVSFLVTTWAYSNAPFVLALPFERTEAVLAGMVAAFEFFGCVPKEVWWDYVAGNIIPPDLAGHGGEELEGRDHALEDRLGALERQRQDEGGVGIGPGGDEEGDQAAAVGEVDMDVSEIGLEAPAWEMSQGDESLAVSDAERGQDNRWEIPDS